MKQAASEKDLLDIENDIERIQTAIKNKLGVSNPFLADIAYHIITPHNNSTRSRLLLQSANLFKKPDEDVICLLYTSPSPRDVEESRMPSSA